MDEGLVKRLHYLANGTGDFETRTLSEAANCIKQLIERNKQLEAALWDIVADCEADYPPSYGAIRNLARAALGEKKDVAED